MNYDEFAGIWLSVKKNAEDYFIEFIFILLCIQVNDEFAALVGDFTTLRSAWTSVRDPTLAFCEIVAGTNSGVRNQLQCITDEYNGGQFLFQVWQSSREFLHLEYITTLLAYVM